MRSVLNKIAACDTIGPNLTLKYKKKPRIQTWIGGVLIVVIYIVMGLGFAYFSRDIFMRINPITKVSKGTEEIVTLPARDYPLSMLIADTRVMPVQLRPDLEASIEIEIVSWITSIDATGGVSSKPIYLKVKKCSNEILNLSEEEFDSNISPYSICIDYSQAYDANGNKVDDEIRMHIERNTSAFQNITIRVKQCDEQKNPGCSQAFKDEGFLYVFISKYNSFVDFDDYESPVQKSTGHFDFQISPGLYSRKLIDISFNEFISDDGIILANKSTTTFVTTELAGSNVMNYSESNRFLCSYSYSMGLIKERFERRYTRIQEILANMGGFIKALMLAGSFLVKYYAEFSFFKSFGSELNAVIRTQTTNGPEIINNYIGKLDQSNQKISKLETVRQVNTEVSFLAFLSSLFFKNSNKNKVERTQVDKYTDIEYISACLVKLETLLNNNNLK